VPAQWVSDPHREDLKACTERLIDYPTLWRGIQEVDHRYSRLTGSEGGASRPERGGGSGGKT